MLILNDSQPRGLGYYEIDNRLTNAEMPVGQRHFEADTYTCSHCNAVVVLNPNRVRERYKCNGCNHHICDDCKAKRLMGNPCKTMKQAIEESMESAARHAEFPSIILP